MNHCILPSSWEEWHLRQSRRCRRNSCAEQGGYHRNQKVVDLPVIGIVKRSYPDSDIYITATKKELDELFETGCEMIAMDATLRDRQMGKSWRILWTMCMNTAFSPWQTAQHMKNVWMRNALALTAYLQPYADTRHIPKMWMVQILSYSKAGGNDQGSDSCGRKNQYAGGFGCCVWGWCLQCSRRWCYHTSKADHRAFCEGLEKVNKEVSR